MCSFSLSRVFLAALALAPVLALAQWQWVDADGHRVFSDQPPPLNTPAEKILTRPGPAPKASAEAPPLKLPEKPPSPTANKAPETELERKNRDLKAKQDEQVRQQKERDAQAIAESCERAKRSAVRLQTGVRIGVINDKGEQDVMSEQARQAETQRVNDYLQANCR